jgi:hypothetical protein
MEEVLTEFGGGSQKGGVAVIPMIPCKARKSGCFGAILSI